MNYQVNTPDSGTTVKLGYHLTLQLVFDANACGSNSAGPIFMSDYGQNKCQQAFENAAEFCK